MEDERVTWIVLISSIFSAIHNCFRFLNGDRNRLALVIINLFTVFLGTGSLYLKRKNQ